VIYESCPHGYPLMKLVYQEMFLRTVVVDTNRSRRSSSQRRRERPPGSQTAANCLVWIGQSELALEPGDETLNAHAGVRAYFGVRCTRLIDISLTQQRRRITSCRPMRSYCKLWMLLKCSEGSEVVRSSYAVHTRRAFIPKIKNHVTRVFTAKQKFQKYIIAYKSIAQNNFISQWIKKYLGYEYISIFLLLPRPFQSFRFVYYIE